MLAAWTTRSHWLPVPTGASAVEEIGGDARLLVLDVTDAASVADPARQVGALAILVNNAGISLDSKLPDEEGVEGFRRPPPRPRASERDREDQSSLWPVSSLRRAMPSLR